MTQKLLDVTQKSVTTNQKFFFKVQTRRLD